MPTLTPDAVLRATAQFFETDPGRWRTEWFSDPDNPECRCTLGGIAWVLSPTGEDDDPYWLPKDEGLRDTAKAAIELLERYLTDELGFDFPDTDDEGRSIHEPLVGYWNDRPGRTVHEVIGTLRAAADAAVCPTCRGAGGWQQHDGLIVECPRGCMTGGVA